MTTQLDPIFKSNSQLFRVEVYDVDGVTPVTPASCVCDVWNKDTGAQVITSQSGTVGAGYAQYNWAGSSTAGRYEAVLTVTISSGVVKSEHFVVTVWSKPPAVGATNTLENLTDELAQDFPAVEGVPSAAQYEQAIKEAVRDFSERCGVEQIGTLNILAGTATYSLPADFLRLIQLDLMASADGVLITSTGLVPVSANWEERYTIRNGQITFFPTPAYSMSRDFRYKAAWIATVNDGDELEYETMGERERRIVLLKAKALLYGKRAQALASETMKYSFGAVSEDLTGQMEEYQKQTFTLHGEYVTACESYNGAAMTASGA